jgi:hypothetical protein
MLMKGLALTILLIAALQAVAQRAHPRVQKYPSPDKGVVVVIVSTKAAEATQESVVEFRSSSGKVLARMDYSSPDGEHGFGVEKAAWTPDSAFFVYSLESSGGHQAWHSPVHFYSRQRTQIFSLDDTLRDAVMNPQFSVEAPDKVTIELYSEKKKLTVSLSSLHPSRPVRPEM